MTKDFVKEYREEESVNRKYNLLIKEMKKVRGEGIEEDVLDFNDEDFRKFLRELNDEVEGSLLLFVSNDFGRPYAFRPEGKRRALLEDLHQEMLTEKYSENEKLNEIRKRVLDYSDFIHKVLVAEHRGDEILYHAPAGQEEETNFLTARQYVGMMDWLLNNKWKGYTEETWREKGVDPEELDTDHLKEVYEY